MIYHPIRGTQLADICGFRHYLKLNELTNSYEVSIICNFGEDMVKTRKFTVPEYNEYVMTCWWLGENYKIVENI